MSRYDDYYEDSHERHKKHEKDERHEECCDHNEFIREQLRCMIDTRVVFFAKGGIHVEGTVRRIRRNFVELISTSGMTAEPVEVESNANGQTLENFLKFFLRIDDIVGFGQETLGD